PKDAQTPRFLRFLLGGDDDRNKSKEGKHKHDKQKSNKSSAHHSHSKPPKASSKQPLNSVISGRHKHDSSHSSDKNHRHHGNHTQRSKKSASSKKAGGSKAPPKSAAALGAGKIEATSAKKPTIRFSEPPVQPSIDPTPTSSGAMLPPMPMPQSNKNTITMPMPIPEHYTISQGGDIAVRKELPKVPDLRLSTFGTDPQNPESKRVAVLQPLSQRYYIESSNANRLSAVSQSSAATIGDKSHASYSDNDEGQQQTVRVYRVLGRRNTNQQELADIQATDAQSPLLVTIAQDGSIVGEVSTKPTMKMPSAFSPAASLQRQRSGNHGSVTSPAASTTSAGIATSVGTGSYTTARMFTGKQRSGDLHQHSEIPAVFDLPDDAVTGVGHGSQGPEGADYYGSSTHFGGPQRRASRRGSDVSDIAMRTHLAANVDHAGASDSSGSQADNGIRSSQRNSLSSSADEQMTEQAFSEWLHLHAVTDQPPPQELRRRSLSISQAFARSSSETPQQPPKQHILSPSLQRRFSPPLSNQNPAAYSDPQRPAYSAGSLDKPDGLVAQLLARVSDLEARFMCTEAIMASIEEKLAGLTTAAAPSLSHSLSMKRMTAAFSAGKMPELKSVDKRS
ncbi:hypothetical protein LPJ81_003485, partial [Coemansia sp. IMI 209127]